MRLPVLQYADVGCPGHPASQPRELPAGKGVGAVQRRSCALNAPPQAAGAAFATSCARSTNRCTFPLGVLGSASTNSISRG